MGIYILKPMCFIIPNPREPMQQWGVSVHTVYYSKGILRCLRPLSTARFRLNTSTWGVPVEASLRVIFYVTKGTKGTRNWTNMNLKFSFTCLLTLSPFFDRARWSWVIMVSFLGDGNDHDRNPHSLPPFVTFLENVCWFSTSSSIRMMLKPASSSYPDWGVDRFRLS